MCLPDLKFEGTTNSEQGGSRQGSKLKRESLVYNTAGYRECPERNVNKTMILIMHGPNSHSWS